MSFFNPIVGRIAYSGVVKMDGEFALPQLQDIVTPPETETAIGVYDGVVYNWNAVTATWDPAGSGQLDMKTATFSADGNTYSFSTPNDFTPAATAVQILPASQDAQLYLKYTITPTEIIIICDICPPAGTNNVSFSITKTA